MPAPLPEDVQQGLIDAYAINRSTRKSAAMFGCSPTAVIGALRRHGIPLVPPGQYERTEESRRQNGDAHRKHTLDESYFNVIDTEEKAYWLGFLTADGCVTDEGKTVSMGLQAGDLKHLLKLRKALKSTHRIYHVEACSRVIDGNLCQCGPAVQVAFYSTRLARALMALGVMPRKSLKETPWNGPEHLMTHYFRGLVDGDGWLTHSAVTHRRPKTSKAAQLMWSIGLCGSFAIVDAFSKFVEAHLGYKVVPKERKNSGFFKVNFCGTLGPQRLADMLYNGSSIHLDRKKTLARKLLRTEFNDRGQLSQLSAEDLRSLYVGNGCNWHAVARALGVEANLVLSRRRVLGMEAQGMPVRRSWAAYSNEDLLALYDEHGTWLRVGAFLGIGDKGISRLVRRRGIPTKMGPRPKV